jgi:Flp pilus assembly protein TadG
MWRSAARVGLLDMARRAMSAASRFSGDRAGGYSIAFAVALVPILGGMAIAVDYAEMTRQRQATLNALDAAGIATARHVVSGATDDQLKAYAKNFFEANLGPVDPADTTLHVQLPSNEAGGGTLKLTADLRFRPAFFPVFTKALKGVADTSGQEFSAATEIRLKNTLEVALVLDNSGSMAYLGSGSGEKRIDLLKAAAKQLVDTLAEQASLIKQVDKPVQFSLVPFAASVNVGPGNAGAAWMDTNGLSPVHHESFDWAALTAANKTAEKVAGVWRKKGVDWGAEENEILSRFSLYKDMKKVESREWVVTSREYVCTEYRSNGTCRRGKWVETGYYDETIVAYASWQGCVEARPYPYNVNDAAPGTLDDFDLFTGDPATLFVPMFAPDEADKGSFNNDYIDDQDGNCASSVPDTGSSTSSQQAAQKRLCKYNNEDPDND